MAIKTIDDYKGLGLKNNNYVRFSTPISDFIDARMQFSGNKIVALEVIKATKGIESTGGSILVGQNVSIGENSSSIFIKDKQGRKFTLAQNLITSTGASPTFVPRVGTETTLIRQGSDIQSQSVSFVTWTDIIVNDSQLNVITFRGDISDTTGLRLIIRENDSNGDIILITKQDELWDEGDGFTLKGTGDTPILGEELVSSVAFFDGAVLHFTLEVKTGTFDIKGDTLVFGGQSSAFVPYFTIVRQDFDLNLLADGGGFVRRLIGDVSIAPGSDVVNGNVTFFERELSVGESVQIREENFTVKQINNPNQFILSSPHIVGAGAGIGGGLNAIVFAEDNVLDVKNFDGTSRLEIDRIGNLIHTGNQFRTLATDLFFASEYMFEAPVLSGTTPKTVGRVDVFQQTSTASLVTGGFTPGFPASTNPLVVIQDASTFVANDIVLIRDTGINDGLYEVSSQIGLLLIIKGVGTIPTTEDSVKEDFFFGEGTGTITKVEISVWRTSSTGTPEHGRGSTTPITYEVLAHAADVPIIATEEFANTNAAFDSELGLPSAQGWTDTEINTGTITQIDDIVFGIQRKVNKYSILASGDTTKSEIPVSAADWINNLTRGFSFRGEGCRITEDISTQSIFSGTGFSAGNDPRPTSIQSRVGIFISENGTNTTITLDGQSAVVLDGTSGKPLIPKDTYFNWEVFVDETPDAGVNFGIATLKVNGVKVKSGGIVASNNAVSDEVSVANSSSTGTTTFFFTGFGVTIYEEGSIKTLSVTTMSADIIQVIRPKGNRNHTVVLPDGNPRKQGNRLEFIGGSARTTLTIKTQNTAAPQSLFNGLNELEINVISSDTISFVNTVDNGNVYLGDFKSEEDIIYDHSGITSSGDNGGPKGMSILNATTFRIEPITAVIVDRSLNSRLPNQTFFDLPQTDHVITGGGDQIVNTYINNLGVYKFRAEEPTAFSITGEIFVGKAVMDAGVITVAVFTPVVAYTGSVDGQAELINGGGHKTSGSLLSAAGANLTIGVTQGSHHQIGRGFLPDPNSPNLCETPAVPVIAFTGTTGNLFLVHADAVGAFIIDAFISNSANPDIDPTTYNPLGTLITVPVNDVTAKRVFQACGTNDIIVYSGTVNYANMAAAEAGFEDETPELLTTRDISYICTILVKETVTDLTAGVTAGDVIFKNRSGDREL